MKTQEEIQTLKDSWKKDPCWDIEDTEGFEEHHQELMAWRIQYESDLQAEEVERIERRRRVVSFEAGIDDAEIADAIWTFGEIGNAARRLAKETESGTGTEIQVHAILLLAAQIKRVGDILLEQFESMNAESQTDFMIKLYKE